MRSKFVRFWHRNGGKPQMRTDFGEVTKCHIQFFWREFPSSRASSRCFMKKIKPREYPIEMFPRLERGNFDARKVCSDRMIYVRTFYNTNEGLKSLTLFRQYVKLTYLPFFRVTGLNCGRFIHRLHRIRITFLGIKCIFEEQLMACKDQNSSVKNGEWLANQSLYTFRKVVEFILLS